MKRILLISLGLALVSLSTIAKKTPPSQVQAEKVVEAKIYIVKTEHEVALASLVKAVGDFWPWKNESSVVEASKLADLMATDENKIIFHYIYNDYKRTNMSDLPESYNQEDWGSKRDVIRKYQKSTYKLPMLKVVLNNNEYVIHRNLDKFNPTVGELASMVQHAANEYLYALEHPTGRTKMDSQLKAFVKDLKTPELWVNREDIANDIMEEKKMAKSYPKDIYVSAPKVLETAILEKKANMMYVISVPVNDIINEYYLVRASDGKRIAIANGNHLIGASVIKSFWKKMLKMNAD